MKAAPSICAVGYVDYSQYFLPFDGFRGILALIEDCLKGENEVRVVAKSAGLALISLNIKREVNYDLSNIDEACKPLTYDELFEHIKKYLEYVKLSRIAQESSGARGFNLPFNLKGAIQEVVFKPGCDAAYATTVKDQMRAAGCEEIPIRQARK